MSATELKAWILNEVSEFDPRDSEPSEMYAAVVRELKIRTLEAGFPELSVSLPIEDKKYAVSAVGQLRRVFEALETPAAPIAVPESATALTVKQAAAKYQLGLRTVYRLIENGMPVTRVGRAIRINPVDLELWLSEGEGELSEGEFD